MSVQTIRDRVGIHAFLQRNADLHIYSLGDLDDFFWPYTTWYGWQEDGAIEEIALVYAGQAMPTVVAISQRPAAMRRLLVEATPLLPKLFYAHLSPGVEDAFHDNYAIESHGPHQKMALRDIARVCGVDGSQAVRLTPQDADDLRRLYSESYPGNWFDLRMLQMGHYFGLREAGRLVSVAGVHVYSERYGVAAVGNIVTHPACRNRGYATQVTARLCQSLLQKVRHIGLNVKIDNAPAVACYRKLGFESVTSYGEFSIARRT
jgi:ribosomal protein S18 acetylase RimI-like enzyme